MKIFRNFQTLNKEDKKILITGAVLLLLIADADFLFGTGNIFEFIKSLLPNFFADVISVLITTYLLAKLLEKRETERKKREAYIILGTDLGKLINTIATYYIWYITKMAPIQDTENQEDQSDINENGDEEDYLIKIPGKLAGEYDVVTHIFKDKDFSNSIIRNRQVLRNQLKSIINNIENYIDEDFFVRGYKKKKPILKDGTIGEEEVTINYLEFCEWFRVQCVEDINKFRSETEYLNVLPPELKISLIKIDRYFKDRIFDPVNTEFNEVDLKQAQVNVNGLRDMFIEIGNEVMLILNYFKEYEESHGI
ncbi:hypothetical protein [Bacillus mycoides]|uniref:hypothetical protein n=1 Tax=Bacillus mycoides TaxID=1405 RepID=UPI001F1344F2|nr:hypothetical protein [Bacillus mycoides]